MVLWLTPSTVHVVYEWPLAVVGRRFFGWKRRRKSNVRKHQMEQAIKWLSTLDTLTMIIYSIWIPNPERSKQTTTDMNDNSIHLGVNKRLDWLAYPVFLNTKLWNNDPIWFERIYNWYGNLKFQLLLFFQNVARLIMYFTI